MNQDEKASPRQVLSENLRRLMDAHPELNTIKKVALASRKSLSNGKVGRIYAASHTTDIDTLQHLADVFKLQPWQLMVEGINPEALPRLADASVLAEILDAVGASASKERIPPVNRATDELKHSSGPVGPALKKALNNAQGNPKSERGKAGKGTKPRTHRRV